LKMRYR